MWVYVQVISCELNFNECIFKKLLELNLHLFLSVLCITQIRQDNKVSANFVTVS